VLSFILVLLLVFWCAGMIVSGEERGSYYCYPRTAANQLSNTANYNATRSFSYKLLVCCNKGYVAGPIVKELLDAGMTVHCPVRSPNHKEKLKYLTDIADASKGSIKFFKADLVDEGSYLESMKGCSIVIHTASPFVMDVEPAKVEEVLFTPAINGTRNILDSVSKTPTVKRVVLTSSCFAMLTDAADCRDAPNGIVTEECWNTTASKTYNPYARSKLLAEKEAWKIADTQSQYKLVVINPAWVFGPGLKVHPSSESYAFAKMLGDGTLKSGAPDIGVFMVDVRDVAKAHMGAAFEEGAEGRYITMGHNTAIVDFGKTLAAQEKYKDYPIPTTSPPWFLLWLIAPYIGMTRTAIWRGSGITATLDNSKSIKDLKLTYHSMADTFSDMFDQMIEAGTIPTPATK
jgi:nucleoside-diphosphate-sugar epimerase